MAYVLAAFLATFCFLLSVHAGERLLWFGLASFNLSAWMNLKGYVLLSFVIFTSQILLMLFFSFWNQSFVMHAHIKPFRYFKPAFLISCLFMVCNFLIWPPLQLGPVCEEASSVAVVVFFLIALGFSGLVLVAGLNLFSEERPS